MEMSLVIILNDTLSLNFKNTFLIVNKILHIFSCVSWLVYYWMYLKSSLPILNKSRICKIFSIFQKTLTNKSRLHLLGDAPEREETVDWPQTQQLKLGIEWKSSLPHANAANNAGSLYLIQGTSTHAPMTHCYSNVTSRADIPTVM